MKAKRFILMLLVMLGSVAGAWAQEPTKLHLTYVDKQGDIRSPENAFDGILSYESLIIVRNISSNPYITFKTDFPVRVDQLSIYYSDRNTYVTSFELKGLSNEGDDWGTHGISLLQKTGLGMPDMDYISRVFSQGPISITCNQEDRYQYFRIYFNSASRDDLDITEIELYVTCNHSYPTGTDVCSKCGYKDETVLHEHVYSTDWSYDKDGHWHECSGTIGKCNSPRGNYASHSGGLTCSVCRMPHFHRFDNAGSCTVEDCSYSVSSISSESFEPQESYGGSNSSSTANLGNLFDGDTETKWRAGVTATAIFHMLTPVRIDGYSFYSEGSDYYLPHPKSWTLYGYDENSNTWQTVHSVTGASPSDGWNNYRFVNSDGPLYSYYKLEITKLQRDHLACKTNIGGLTLDNNNIHTHINSAEWHSDNYGHWHKCMGEGICYEPKRDYAEHQFDGGLSCVCGFQHSHQFDGSGVCTTENCGYNAKDLVGFMTEVEDESIFYGSRSTNKTEIINLFDGDTSTKWQPRAAGAPTDIHTVTAIFQTLHPVVINGYSFYCDRSDFYNKACLPKSWNLYGYNEDNHSWELLDKRNDQEATADCYNSYRFKNEGGLSYKYFKWEVTSYGTIYGYPGHINIGDFTLDAQDVHHVHRYSEEWSSDDSGHWHQCLINIGECDAPRNDEVEHTHTTYSAKCDVCGHVNTHNHEWDVNVESCISCGAQHIHQFDGNGVCTTANCGYNAKDLVGFISEVEDESIFGGSQSTNKTEIRNLFDGDISTKWIPTVGSSPTSLHTVTAIFKTLQPVVMTGYSFYCEKYNTDYYSKTCLPKSWNLYGYNTTTNNWDLLDAINDQEAKANCYNSYRFKNEEGQSYQYFKWEVTSTTFADFSIHLDISEFTLDIHNHNYEWRSDETKHWMVCVNEEGKCNIKKKSEAEHNIHESILCDTENYQCDVCGYVDEAKKAQIEARDYFCLKAVDGSVTLGMQKTGEPDDCTLQVSADGNNWSEPMTLSETTANIVTIPSGETRYFRRGSTTAADRISDDADNYWTFSMDGSANVEADGNMMSLLDMTCQQSTIANEAAFLYLFKGCTLLKSVTIKSPVLLTCGPLRDIFGGQVTSFIIDTDVTTIGNQSFQNTAITSIIIPEGVTSIGNNSFGSCSGLTSIVIPSTVRSIGANAFNRCRITQYTLNCPSSCAFGDNALSGASGYKIIVPALTTHSWTSNPMWSTYGSHFTEPTFTLHANQDPDNEGNYYTTFFNSHYAYTLPNSVKAYTATIGEENNEKVVMLTAIEGDILPKGTAVLLHSNTTGDMLMTVSNENGNEYGENLFSGVDVETAQSGTNYMLSYGQNGLGFYKMKEDMMLSANKTFLPQSAAMANARAFRMVFTDDNEVDGIQQIENGESVIENSAIYNLNGMRLNKLQKGINIVNGKKIIVK